MRVDSMYEYAMKSRTGSRPYNEDKIWMHDRGTDQLFALADGLGGMGNGGMAASIAVKSVIGRFRWDREEHFLPRAMETAQSAVNYGKKCHPEASGMSSTLALLQLGRGRAQWAHVGDSRIYMFRRRRVLHQTEDHSIPQMLVNMGEITPDQIRHHPDRNRLLRTLGWEWTDQGYTLSEPVQLMRGDAFLLCSDGFWEEIQERDMIRTLDRSKDAAGWLEEMKELVERNGRHTDMDNYSAICVRVR